MFLARSSWLWMVVAVMYVTVVTAKRKREDVEYVQSTEVLDIENEDISQEREPCQCGVFMTQQLGAKGKRGRGRGPPTGDPVVTYDTEAPCRPCGTPGFKQCISKCLDVILKYLPKAGPVICGAVERDVNREKAFLYVKNCGAEWSATNFSAGKEFCCTDGQHHKC